MTYLLCMQSIDKMLFCVPTLDDVNASSRKSEFFTFLEECLFPTQFLIQDTDLRS